MLQMEDNRLSFTVFHTASESLRLSLKILAFCSFHRHHMAIPRKAPHIDMIIGFLIAFGSHSFRVWAG